MAGPVAVGDIVAIIQLCQELARLVSVMKGAPTEYESFVHSLNSMHATFLSISEDIESGIAPSSSSVTGGHSESLHRLLSEIALTRTALQKAGAVLRERYAEDANSHPLRVLYRRFRWRVTRVEFEKSIRSVREHMINVIALTGTQQLQYTAKLHESVAALGLQLNDRPPAIGLPGSGGVPQDHVRFQYGLGETTYLLNNICSDAQNVHEFLKVMFSKYPGKRHIAKRHYKLFCNTNSHQPQELTQASWSVLVSSGSSVFLAFVVGTWQMSCVNFCPGCNRKNPGEWYSWRNCQCGCVYFVRETDGLDYEPMDGFWTGEAEDLTDYNGSRHLTSRKNTIHSLTSAGIETTSKQLSKPVGTASLPDDIQEHPSDELYFRCMIMVYDPIFNFVCRNVFCRCILGATSLTSNEPPIEILCALPCSKHARSGIRPKVDAISRQLIDYAEDPYFEKYGGYETFTRIAQFLNQHTIAIAFVDFGKLCPDTALDDGKMRDIIAEHSAAVSQYRREVLSQLRSH